MKKTIIFILFIIISSFLYGGEYKSYEISLGMGMGESSEKNAFNVPSGDYEITPDFLLLAKAVYNYNELMAFGFHAYAFSDTFAGVPVVFEGDSFTSEVDYRYSANYYGAHLRMTFWRGFIRPYVCFGAGFASVSLNEEHSGVLSGGGFVMMTAAGFEAPIGDNLAAGVEGVINSGMVNWEREVFSNSESKEIDVSFYGIMIYISWQDDFSG